MRHISQVESEVQLCSEVNNGAVSASEEMFPDITALVVGVSVLIEEVKTLLFPQAETANNSIIKTVYRFTFVVPKQSVALFLITELMSLDLLNP